ncbi:MAG TPA: selenocysteine-specific translation elongation factor [Bacteroidales bacterium]|nr:selenocysteine-specific translation elongation factor [Bacteroidales bacterium]HRZ49316.1 selenocysteine-specific translation elongation factor [Bacteroidales bacterium]
MEKHLIIGTAGHIDHGKTSLVKMLTGIDCDTHKEEKQRGITINLGFAWADLPGGHTAGIIDVPGHKDFISTMIGGASGIDMVLLVIAADCGIMPQTLEHLQIVTSLGIQKGVVALSRADLADEELLLMAEAEITDLLEDTPLKGSPVIAVSSLTGTGKKALLEALARVAAEIPSRDPGPLFRMYIDRIFTVKGFGSVVTGTVINGRLKAGEELFILPGNTGSIKVRSLERHHKPAAEVVAGDRAAINLTGLKREDFDRGMILCSKPLDPCVMMDAEISLFQHAPSLPVWFHAMFIAGTFECQVKVHLLNHDSVKGGETALVQIHLGKPAVLLAKDRFILRNTAEDETIGGGTVLETNPLHHRKRSENLILELDRLREGLMGTASLRELIHQELKKEFAPMTPEELAARLHVTSDEVLRETAEDHPGFLVYRDGEVLLLVNTHCDARHRSTLLKALAGYHEKNPLSAGGMQVQELAGKTGLAKHPRGKSWLSMLLQKMQQEGKTDTFQDTWILAGHTVQIDPKTTAEIEWLENELLAYGDQKPSLAELEEKAAEKKISRAQIKSYLNRLSDEGRIAYCQGDFLHTTILNRYRELLLQKLSVNPQGMDINTFKELIPGSKKFRALLVDFLEAEKSIRLETGHETETRLYIHQKKL